MPNEARRSPVCACGRCYVLLLASVFFRTLAETRTVKKKEKKKIVRKEHFYKGAELRMQIKQLLKLRTAQPITTCDGDDNNTQIQWLRLGFGFGF